MRGDTYMDIKQTQKILEKPAGFPFTIEDILLINHALDSAILSTQDYLKNNYDPKLKDRLSDFKAMRSDLNGYLQSTGYVFK